jgi:hypothetical protein
MTELTALGITGPAAASNLAGMPPTVWAYDLAPEAGQRQCLCDETEWLRGGNQAAGVHSSSQWRGAGVAAGRDQLAHHPRRYEADCRRATWAGRTTRHGYCCGAIMARASALRTGAQ